MSNYSQKLSHGCLLFLLTTSIGLEPIRGLAQVTVQTPNPTPTPTPPVTRVCPAQLGGRIEQVMNRANFARTRWGVLIQPLASNQTLYSHDAQKFFTPASVTKLLTTAAAMQQLGSNFQFRTSIMGEGNGVLRVIGRGDPSVNDNQLTALAKQVQQAGITNISQLIADDSFVTGDTVESSWQWEDIQSDYGAPVGSFIVNQNTFSISVAPSAIAQPLKITWDDISETSKWRVVNQTTTVAANQPGSVNVTRDLSGNVLRITGQLPLNSAPTKITLPVVDPNNFFLRRLRVSLAQQNIRLGDTTVGTGTGTQEIASIQSPPLSQLIAKTNTDSDNSYAESLLRALAYRQNRPLSQPSANIGLDILRQTLTSMGVDAASYRIVDGSGLSRKNLISPETLVQLLKAVERTNYKTEFRASLPIAGQTGTLKNRFRNTPAVNIVQAKTGTMTGVVALAGHIQPPNYEPLVFSIIVNQSDEPARNIRQGIDEVVVLLAQLQRC